MMRSNNWLFHSCHKMLAVLITDLDQVSGIPEDCLLHIRNNSPATLWFFLVQICYRLYKYLPYHAPIRRRSDLEDFLYDKYLAEDEELAKKRATMESLYDDWAEYKSLFVSEATIKRDRNTWKALYKDAPIVKKPLVSITKTELERWLLSVIRSKNMNSHQFTNFISVVRQLMAYAEEIGIIESNPAEKIHIQKKRILKPEVKGPAITQVFMEDERQMLIKHAMEQYAKHRDTVQIFTSLAIAFLLYVPLRRGELVALRFDDLDGNRLYLTDSYSHDMKCLKGRLKDIEGWRTVDVVPPALEIIEKIRQERIRLGMPTDGCIFTVNEKYSSLYSALGKSINKYCDELGIPRRSLHKTRKTCLGTKTSERHLTRIATTLLLTRRDTEQFQHHWPRSSNQCKTTDALKSLIIQRFGGVVRRGKNPTTSNQIQPLPELKNR